MTGNAAGYGRERGRSGNVDGVCWHGERTGAADKDGDGHGGEMNGEVDEIGRPGL